MSEQKEKVNAGTITRTIVLALALFNQVMTATGHAILPIDDETVNNLVSSACTVVAACIAWWNTNGFTKAGIKGENYIKELKAEQKNQK